jgi:class 3 adenylate cyclase
MSIGLHSGLIVVGAIGDNQHLEYLTIGYSVNMAKGFNPPTGLEKCWSPFR